MLDLDGGTVLEFSDPLIRERRRQLAAGRGYEIVGQELIVYVRSRETLTQKTA